jgi:hypothetical protein
MKSTQLCVQNWFPGSNEMMDMMPRGRPQSMTMTLQLECSQQSLTFIRPPTLQKQGLSHSPDTPYSPEIATSIWEATQEQVVIV